MEQFSNAAGANLDGGVDATTTTVVVKNPVNVPSSGTFRALIDTEYLMVTAVSGSTWTVERGSEGSTAAAHADNAPINLIVTKGAIDSILTVSQDGTEVGSRRHLNLEAGSNVALTVADDPSNARVNVNIAMEASSAATKVVLATGTLYYVVDGNQEKAWTVDLTALSPALTQTLPNIGVIATCAQFGDGGVPNPTAGAIWGIAEAYVGNSDGSTTGVPDSLYIRVTRVGGVTATGYTVTVFWSLIDYEAMASSVWSGGATVDSTASRPGPSTHNGQIFAPTDGVSLDISDGTSWTSFGPISRLTPPVLADFTWVNQGTATVSQSGNALYLVDPSGTSDNIRILTQAAPAPPYTLTVAVLPNWNPTYTNYRMAGPCVYDSTSGKVMTWGLILNTPPSQTAGIYYNGVTSFNGNFSRVNLSREPMWWRIRDDGTHLMFSSSTDGLNYVQSSSLGRTAFLTPNTIGFYLNPGGASGATLLSWGVTSG